MRPFEIADDGVRMTVLALPHPTATRRFGRSGGGHAAVPSTPGSRSGKLEEIRMLLDQDAYDVDPHKVADAIVARLLAGRTVRDGSVAHAR
jgi:hypothetical protein